MRVSDNSGHLEGLGETVLGCDPFKGRSCGPVSALTRPQPTDPWGQKLRHRLELETVPCPGRPPRGTVPSPAGTSAAAPAGAVPPAGTALEPGSLRPSPGPRCGRWESCGRGSPPPLPGPELPWPGLGLPLQDPAAASALRLREGGRRLEWWAPLLGERR